MTREPYRNPVQFRNSSLRTFRPFALLRSPKRISKTVMAVIQTSIGSTPSSQRTTASSATSLMSAESTLVSRRITRRTPQGGQPVRAVPASAPPTPGRRSGELRECPAGREKAYQRSPLRAGSRAPLLPYYNRSDLRVDATGASRPHPASGQQASPSTPTARCR